MKRTIECKVTSDGTPQVRVPMYAGVAGEHNSTELVFTGDAGSFVGGGELVRISFCGGDGTVVSTDLLTMTSDESGWRVSYALPSALTVLGGQITARLVLSRMENGAETQTAISGGVVLFLDDGGMENGTPFWTAVSQMLVNTTNAADQARNYAYDAKKHEESALSHASDAYSFAERANVSCEIAEQRAAKAIQSAEEARSCAEEVYASVEDAGNYAKQSQQSALEAEDGKTAAYQAAAVASEAASIAERKEQSAANAALEAENSKTYAQQAADVSSEASSKAKHEANMASDAAMEARHHANAAKAAISEAANALCDTVCGEYVCLTDVSPISHVLECKVMQKNSYNMSDIVVLTYGKNLLHPNEHSGTVGGYSCTPNVDGSVTISGEAVSTETHVFSIAQRDASNKVTPVRLVANQAYALSVTKDGEPFFDYKARIDLADGTTVYKFDSIASQDRELGIVYIEFTPGIGDTEVCGTYRAQLELGDTSTVYEPFIGGMYTPNTDGVVEGIASVSPCMIITTDIGALEIECMYHKNVATVIQEIKSGQLQPKAVENYLGEFEQSEIWGMRPPTIEIGDIVYNLNCEAFIMYTGNGNTGWEQYGNVFLVYTSEGPRLLLDPKQAKMNGGNSGGSGIHVGSDEPPIGASVWINPNGKVFDASFISDMIAESITEYDTEAMALLGEDGDTE